MLSALYVVVSLIILEGLLSFDNALVLAAMVQPLPEKQQKLALRIGIVGAYLMRGLSIFLRRLPHSEPLAQARRCSLAALSDVLQSGQHRR